MAKHRTCLSTQILGNALSLAYPMMVLVTDSEAAYSTCCQGATSPAAQDLSSASHSFYHLGISAPPVFPLFVFFYSSTFASLISSLSMAI